MPGSRLTTPKPHMPPSATHPDHTATAAGEAMRNRGQRGIPRRVLIVVTVSPSPDRLRVLAGITPPAGWSRCSMAGRPFYPPGVVREPAAVADERVHQLVHLAEILRDTADAGEHGLDGGNEAVQDLSRGLGYGSGLPGVPGPCVCVLDSGLSFIYGGLLRAVAAGARLADRPCDGGSELAVGGINVSLGDGEGLLCGLLESRDLGEQGRGGAAALLKLVFGVADAFQELPLRPVAGVNPPVRLGASVIADGHGRVKDPECGNQAGDGIPVRAGLLGACEDFPGQLGQVAGLGEHLGLDVQLAGLLCAHPAHPSSLSTSPEDEGIPLPRFATERHRGVVRESVGQVVRESSFPLLSDGFRTTCEPPAAGSRTRPLFTHCPSPAPVSAGSPSSVPAGSRVRCPRCRGLSCPAISRAFSSISRVSSSHSTRPPATASASISIVPYGLVTGSGSGPGFSAAAMLLVSSQRAAGPWPTCDATPALRAAFRYSYAFVFLTLAASSTSALVVPSASSLSKMAVTPAGMPGIIRAVRGGAAGDVAAAAGALGGGVAAGRARLPWLLPGSRPTARARRPLRLSGSLDAGSRPLSSTSC